MNELRDNEIGKEPWKKGSVWQVFITSLRLGLTSFGGPIAHLGYFRSEYVEQKKWLDDKAYADLVSLSQFLPGPSSSQVGIGIGWMRAGFFGALAAWTGFTLPSVILLVLFAFAVSSWEVMDTGWIYGLKLVAVAIVAHALMGMVRSLAPDRIRGSIMIATTIIILLIQNPFIQVGLIVMGGIAGRIFIKPVISQKEPQAFNVPIGKKTALICLSVFFALLALLPLLRGWFSHTYVALLDSFYRVGSLVFGGGHVVLPLLQNEMVNSGWVSEEAFIAGYGAAQAVPGPLFTFAAYLGASTETNIDALAGAGIAIFAIFLPSFLLLAGALPFWDTIRKRAAFQTALLGINAAVVGILFAALYDPMFTGTIHSPVDFLIVLAAFGLLQLWKAPPWLVVLLTALAGMLVYSLL